MRMCSTKSITDGMILGKSIYHMNGRLLLGAGFRISAEVRSRLLDRGVSFVYVMEEGTEDVVPEDVISDEIRRQATSVLTEQADRVRKQIQFQNMTRERLYEMLKNGYLKDINIARDARATVEEILKDISTSGTTFFNSLSCKAKDTYLLDHSVNTTILAILIGRKYRFNHQELMDLALGCFLHDFGKIIVEKIREASGEALAGELLEEHPTFGYLLLRSNRDTSPMICQIVNQHHERQDGSGYPIGLKGQNLPPVKVQVRETKGSIYRLAEICCVADAFDRLVMNPDMEQKLGPGEAMKHLIVGAGSKFNKEIVAAVHGIVPHFPVGAYIRIRSGTDPSLLGFRGVVAKVSEEHLDRPFIILLQDKIGRKVAPFAVDTATFPTLDLEIII